MSTKVPTVLDYQEEAKLVDALKNLMAHSCRIDIATGTFEIGAFLALETHWQTMEKLRILMGDETTRRTRKEIISGLKEGTNGSIEDEKERDDSLKGLPAVRKAMAEKKIALKVSPVFLGSHKAFSRRMLHQTDSYWTSHIRSVSGTASVSVNEVP
jgi:hypothetical protein